jgi:hypothetical protein
MDFLTLILIIESIILACQVVVTQLLATIVSCYAALHIGVQALEEYLGKCPRPSSGSSHEYAHPPEFAAH